MKLRKKKDTFENLCERVHELSFSIDQQKLELAEVLALLEQCKHHVVIATASAKDNYGVTPQFRDNSWLFNDN